MPRDMPRVRDATCVERWCPRLKNDMKGARKSELQQRGATQREERVRGKEKHYTARR